MGSQICEMENNGVIVIGRVVKGDFESTDEIEELGAAVDALGRKLGKNLGIVYCGSTINWPDDFEYTPIVAGIITHVHWGDEEAEPGPLPAAALTKEPVPGELWELIAEKGKKVSGEDQVLLAIAGWTWASIHGNDGERIVGTSGEDSGYVRIDDKPRIMSGKEPLTMKASYC